MNKNYYLIGLIFLIGLISVSSVHALSTTNLKAYYSFDQATGNAYDSLGVYNLTNSGTATFIQGKIINGSQMGTTLAGSQMQSRTDGLGINLKSTWTISMWVNITPQSYSGATGYTLIDLRSTTGTSAYLIVSLRNGSGTRELVINSATVNVLNYSFSYNVFNHLTLTSNGSNTKVYINNTLLAWFNTTGSGAGGNYLHVGDTTNGYPYTADELSFWSRELDSSEVSELYNGGSGFAYPFVSTSYSNISFYSQSPIDITDLTLFSQNVNITYNYSTINLTNPKLNYTVYGGSYCLQYINGTCLKLNNTYATITQLSNSTSGNFSLISYSLGENNIYNYVINLNGSVFDNTNNTQILNTPNQWFVDTQYFNGTEQYNIYEAMINTTSTGSGSEYVCNSSWNNATPINNSNCQLIRTFNNMVGYNHTHSNNNSHNLFPYTIINGKFNGLRVTATNTRYFVTVRTTGTVMVYYSPNTTRTDTNKICNTGTCNNVVGTLNAHNHFWTNQEYLTYQGQGTFNGTFYNTSFTNEIIDVGALAPTSPTITNPLNTIQSTRYMNITYTNATVNAIGGTINRYNISLLNNDLTFNRTIIGNNSLNNNYYWDVYAQNLSISDYYVQVCAIDSLDQSSCDFQWFNLIRNAGLNVTVYNSTGSIINNYNITYLNLNTSDSVTTSTTTGSITLNTLYGDSYQLLVDASGYAYYYQNKTINNYVGSLNIYLFLENSVNITVRDETNNSIIASATTVTFSSNTTQYTYTVSGNLFVSGLAPDTYVVTFVNGNYSIRTYTITVGVKSTQTLTAYLLSAYQTTVFTYIDSSTGTPIANVYAVMYGFVNGTLTPVASQISDPTGRIQWNFKINTPYQFYSEKTDYVSKTFSLSPAILFTAYNVPMSTSGNVAILDDINIYYTPKQFTANTITPMTIYFQSPNGLLTNYSYTLTNCYNSTGSGVNVNGQGFLLNVNTTGCTDTNIILRTTYSTSTGLTFNNSYNIPLVGTIGNFTILSNSQQQFGMGIFERTLIVVAITLVVGGVASLLGGIIAGSVIGLAILGYFSLITGFINPSATLIVLIVGVILLISKGVNQ